MSERRAGVDIEHRLPKARRCELLEVARSGAYYRPTPVTARDRALMRLIDESHLRWPFYGSHRLRDELHARGHPINRKRVQYPGHGLLHRCPGRGPGAFWGAGDFQQ